ncbi:MAG: hypothetical protein HY275_14220 [Gemmatimonadetes bacterium]|nr:hypothetical protein [Gemmatimonadota bacterium]
MAYQAQRSLRYEYELFVENEIERYKDSVPRNTILAIGDEAVANLDRATQFALTELVLVDEVDRIIARRLRLPTYDAWKRRRLRSIARFRDPMHWGMSPDAPLVRALPQADDARVLVAGAHDEASALFLAANGCRVTAVEASEDMVERIMAAAHAAGLAERVNGVVSGLADWNPEGPITGVVFSAEALDALPAHDRARVLELLQGATRDGGVHLVQAIAAGSTALMLDELRASYDGWEISVDRSMGAPAFLARKSA